MLITKIEIQARNPERVNLYADGKFWVGIGRSVCLHLGLKEGQEVSPDLLAKLGALEESDRVWQYALKVLGLAPKTVGQMERQLRLKFGRSQAERVVARLLEGELLDDAEVARMYVEHEKLSRTKSRLEIMLGLKTRLVPDPLAQAALANLPEDHDLTTAVKLAGNKLRQMKGAGDTTKTAQYLSRKGFSYSVVRAALVQLDREVEEAG